jgi:hypothetical protein
MRKQLTRSLGTPELRVRLWTLKDKDSLFRAKEPDQHIVELAARKPGGGVVILMEKSYLDPVLARHHYNGFLAAFGLPERYISAKKAD